MTQRKDLVTITENELSKEKARQLMLSKKLEKLPVVCEKGFYIRGLINLKDLKEDSDRKVLDSFGRLLCGGAVGASEEEIVRAKKLVQAGCDVLVLDVANGHSELAIRTVQ